MKTDVMESQGRLSPGEAATTLTPPITLILNWQALVKQ